MPMNELKEMRFAPATIRGEVRVPSSKSQAHRALIGAALAGHSVVREVDLSNDITATTQALQALGASLSYDPDSRTFVSGNALSPKPDAGEIDCGESASTLRFMIPIAAALGTRVVFTGGGRLPKRTTELYKPLFAAGGATLIYPENGDFLPLQVSGKLRAGEYRLRGDISSQFVTGLLLALSITEGHSEAVITTKLESKPYADLTLEVLRHFGASCHEEPRGDSGVFYRIDGVSTLTPCDFTVEGDCSQAAFFAVAAAIGGDVVIKGINPSTLQGDYQLFAIMKHFGASVEYNTSGIRVSRGTLRGIEIDAADIPDLVPALAVAAALADGETRIFNAERLRIKESDRIASTADLLRSLGGEVRETADGLIITGKKRLHGGNVASYGDHRIAMAAAAASVGCDKDVIVDDMHCINKSYPEFVNDWQSLIG